MSAGLPVVAEAGGELLEADALIFIRVSRSKIAATRSAFLPSSGGRAANLHRDSRLH